MNAATNKGLTSMNIDVEDYSGLKIVRLHGELTAEDDGLLVGTVSDLVSQRGSRVLLDLHDVPYMNSTGLNELVRITAQANVQESRVVLASPSAFVAGVLQTTQLDRFFEVYESVDAALKHLR